MRNVLNIEASKILVPAWHVRQDTAHFSSLHPKNLLTSRSESATKALEPNNSRIAVTRLADALLRVFLCPRFIDGGSPVAAMPGAVYSQLLAPATRGRTAFGWRVLMPE